VLGRIEFVDPTRDDGNVTSDRNIEVNVSINESDLDEVVWNWNGTNYSVMNDSLILMYNFDNVSALGENDTRVVDVSGGGNNGTVNGASWNSSGKHGGAFEFFIDDYIETDIVPDPRDASSFSYWVNIRSFTSITFACGAHDEDDHRYYAGLRSNLEVFFGLGDSYISSGSGGASGVDIGEWVMITATTNGTFGRIYINGIEKDNLSYSSDNASLYSFWVGAQHASAGPEEDINGTIDEVRIWNRSLSAEEVEQMYMSNLRKYDDDKWLFYVNESGLNPGNYTYEAFAGDEYGAWNSTEERGIVVDLNVVNITLNSPANGSFFDNSSVLLNATVYDIHGGLLPGKFLGYIAVGFDRGWGAGCKFGMEGEWVA